MRRRLFALFLLLYPVASAASAEEPQNRAKLTVTSESLGDSDTGVVTKLTFRFVIPEDVPPGVPLVISGSLTQGGSTRHFRYPLRDDRQQSSLAGIQTLVLGEVQVDARLMIPLEEEAPVIIGKSSATLQIAKTGRVFVAGEEPTAEAVIAEGSVPEGAGAVRIMPPRRDVAPNLFIVDVDVKAPVTRVEFWVGEKKLMTRNAPPYRAELDLGPLPKRVEVRAIGYDKQGRYVDADAFVVNERVLPLEVKITRTQTADGISHFSISVQNSTGKAVRSVVLFAGQKKLAEWVRPPYAIDIPSDRLAGFEFVRASATDESNYEASDLLYLSGSRYSEQIEVNLVELPLTVLGPDGAPLLDVQQKEVHVREDGKPKTISTFDLGSNLPLSLGLLIDHSGSMKPRMEATRTSALEFARRIIKPRDRAFVAGFAFDPSTVAPFTSDVALLERQITALGEAEGGTSLYDAIITGLYRFRSIGGQRALIVLTDGDDTTSRIAFDDLLNYVRSARVPLYFISVGGMLGDLLLPSKIKLLAAETGGNVFSARRAGDLSETYKRVEAELRSQYLISYR
ncbi:MAG TPA: VWA domain-containing protein, partial [Thermoanaerobaculia bacterium]|nr:VWA domain-containing protein [Thermoanaerobaculia bacterium]